MPSYFPENNEPKVMDSADRSLQKINGLLDASSVIDTSKGFQYIGGTSPVSGQWSAIVLAQDTKFHTLTGNGSGVANTTLGSAPELAGGLVLLGSFTTIRLHSGAVLAYNA